MENSEVKKILKVFFKKDYTDYYENYNLEYKRNKWLRITSFSEFNFVKSIVNRDLKKVNRFYEAGDFITLLIYTKGDFFGKHIDGPSYSSKEHKTIKTGGYLLNTDYEGGDFLIKNKILRVGIGELFWFGRDDWHEVKEVTNGIRYSLHFAINENKPKILI